MADIIEFFDTKVLSRSNLPTKNMIDTEYYLSSLVLREIIVTLGLDETPYSTKKLIIDNRRLHRRNSIAHGEHLHIDIDDYLVLHDDVLALLEVFRNQLQNSCVGKQFMRS